MSQTSPRPKPTNSGSRLLSSAENEKLFNLLGKGCTTLASAIVKLYTADPPKRDAWQFRSCGVACFVKDSGMRSYYIRVYDIQMGKMVFEQELYTTFKYKKPTSFFHTFEADEYQAALNFTKDYPEEAHNFQRAVDQKLFARQERKMEKKNLRQSVKETPSRPPAPPLAKTEQKDTYTIKSPVSVNTQKMKQKNKGKDSDKKKKPLTKRDIGFPSGFHHVTHLGYDLAANTQVNVQNLDSDMKALFIELGYGGNQTVGKDVYEFVNDFVTEHGGMDEVKKQLDNKPMTPPPSSGQPPKLPSSRPVGNSPPSPSSDYENFGMKSLPPSPVRAPNSSATNKAPGIPQNKTVSSKRHPSAGKQNTLGKLQRPQKLDLPPSPPVAPPPPSGAASSSPIAPPPPPVAPPPPPVAPTSPLAPAPPPVAPPPPQSPPLPATSVSSMQSPSGSGRGALLEQIRSGGGPLRKTSINEPKPAGDTRGDLLSAIRLGTTLRPVSQPDKGKAPQSPKQEESVLGALARALANRQKQIQVSDNESDDDDDDDIDDDEDWDD